MASAQQIIEFSRNVLTNLSKLDDVLDKTLEPITDYTDTIQDISTPIKSFIAIIDFKRKLNLKAFIKSYSKELGESYEINEKETIKLKNFFENKKNIIYISDIIDSAIQSKSLKSTSLLGVVAAKFIKDKNTINYIDLSIIESLRVMNDFDLENFKSLYEYLSKIYNENKESNEFRTKDFYEKQNPKTINMDRESLELTIEKLKRTNGLTYSVGGIGLIGNAKGAFEINQTTEKLYKLIKETKI